MPVRRDLTPNPKSELPSARTAPIDSGHTLLAIPVFVGLLHAGYSVLFALIWAIAMLAALSLLRAAADMGQQ